MTSSKAKINFQKTFRNNERILIRPYVSAAFHDEDNDGLLPLSALSSPVQVDLTVWDDASPTDTYQLLWNGELVGPEKAVGDIAESGDPLTLEIPIDQLTEGVYSLAYRTVNTENNVADDSDSIRIEVDTTPPGRPQLGPIAFPPEVQNGLTSEELTQLGDILTAEISSYTGMAKHDVTYIVTDRAGNRSTVSLGTSVKLLLAELPTNFPAPIVDQAIGDLIDFSEAKAGVDVDIPLYSGAAEFDRIVLHWGSEILLPVEVPLGNADEDPVLTLTVPYETIAKNPVGKVAILYDVLRQGQLLGSSLSTTVDVFITRPGPIELSAPTIQGTSVSNPNVEDNFIDEDDYELNSRALISWKDGFEISDDLNLHWGQQTIEQWYQIKNSDIEQAVDLKLPIPNTIMRDQGTGAEIPVSYSINRFGNPNISESPQQKVVVRSKEELPGGSAGLEGPVFNTVPGGIVVGPIENPNGADVKIAPYINILKDQTLRLIFTAFDDNNIIIDEAGYEGYRELDENDVVHGYTFRIPDENLRRICKGYGEAFFKVEPPPGSNQSPSNSKVTRVRINMSRPATGCTAR